MTVKQKNRKTDIWADIQIKRQIDRQTKSDIPHTYRREGEKVIEIDKAERVERVEPFKNFMVVK